MNKFGQYWKSILAFVALVVTNLSANVANSDVLAPQTLAEWLVLVGTTVVGTFAVYQKQNESNVPV
jgi:hypothetical protein